MCPSSSKYIQNQSQNRTPGPPQDKAADEDTKLSERWEENQFGADPVMPTHVFKWSIKIIRSIVSNAAFKSKSTRTERSSASVFIKMSLETLRRAVSAESRWWNPDWNSSRRLCLVRNSLRVQTSLVTTTQTDFLLSRYLCFCLRASLLSPSGQRDLWPCWCLVVQSPLWWSCPSPGVTPPLDRRCSLALRTENAFPDESLVSCLQEKSWSETSWSIVSLTKAELKVNFNRKWWRRASSARSRWSTVHQMGQKFRLVKDYDCSGQRQDLHQLIGGLNFVPFSAPYLQPWMNATQWISLYDEKCN